MKRHPNWERSKIISVSLWHDFICKKKIKTTHTDTTHACVHTHTYTHTHELCFRTNKCIQQSCKMQKSVALVSTNNKQFERETKKTIPFTLATKEIKYLGINQKDEKLVY